MNSAPVYNDLMKRRMFYHLSLLLPYIALAFSLAFSLLTGAIESFYDVPSSLGVITGVVVFFGFSGIIWAPLYTWMVVIAWVWSRGRKIEEVRQLYLLSPVLLACSMGIPTLLIEPEGAGSFLLEGILRINNLGFAVPVFIRSIDSETSLVLGVAWLIMAVLCLVIGYAFVGGVLWVEKVLSKRGLLKDEINS